MRFAWASPVFLSSFLHPALRASIYPSRPSGRAAMRLTSFPPVRPPPDAALPLLSLPSVLSGRAAMRETCRFDLPDMT